MTEAYTHEPRLTSKCNPRENPWRIHGVSSGYPWCIHGDDAGVWDARWAARCQKKYVIDRNSMSVRIPFEGLTSADIERNVYSLRSTLSDEAFPQIADTFLYLS